MGKLIDKLDLRGPPVGTIIDAPKQPRKRPQLSKSSPIAKWVELPMLIALAMFGAAPICAVIAKAGAPSFAALLWLGGIILAICAWCDVYIEEV